MKMKKLLASALAAAMVISSMVGAMVTSAATTVGTITAGTVNAVVGETDTITADINIAFPDGVVAPHNIITVALEGYNLTDIALGTVTYADGSAEGVVSIDADGSNLAAGKVLLEAPVDSKAPTVLAIALTATFVDADDVDTVEGTYAIVVNGADMTNVNEDDIAIDAVNGSLVVAAPHVCSAGVATSNEDGTHDIACAGCDALFADNEACNYVDGACDVCGYAEPVTGPVEDAKIGVSGSILISETLGISYVLTGLDAYADFELVVTKNAYSTTNYNVETSDVSVSKANSTYYKGSYYSMVYGFALTDLCLDVTAQVKCYDANGDLVAVSVINEATIKDLAVALYNSTSATATKTLLTDLLNMGTEAQMYFAGRYPNSDLAKVAEEAYPNYGFDQAYATAEVPELTLGAGQTVNNGSTMTGVVSILQSPAIAYVLKPTKTASDLKAVISFYDAYTKTTKTTTVAGSEMTLYKGSYYYNFSTLPLYSSNAVITADLYDGETLLGTYTYTVEQYISENLDGALGGFMTSIAKFGASARTYFKIG